jgi:hypothetical protein
MRDCGIKEERGEYTTEGLRERETSKGVSEGGKERHECG